MAYNLTPQDVRDICPDVAATDAALTLMIAAMNCKLAPCLEASYVDCPEMGELIFTSFVCHVATIQSQAGQVTSQKWADGDSVGYASYVEGGTGLNATNHGQNVMMLDTARCVANAFPNPKVFVVTVGTSGSQEPPYS